MGFFDSLTGGNIGNATLDGITKNRNLLTNFSNAANSLINTGENSSIAQLYNAATQFQPFQTAGVNATNMTSNALGLNGADGTKAAQSAFQTGPGYQFAVDEGMRGAERAASASGMLGSGNLYDELMKRGQGYANQEYGSWLDRLNGLSSQGLQGASGVASAYGKMADVYGNNAADKVGISNLVTQGNMGSNKDEASVLEQKAQNENSFFGNLLGGIGSIAGKAFTGGLF